MWCTETGGKPMKSSEAQLSLEMVAWWEFESHCSVVTALSPPLTRYQGSVSIWVVIGWERRVMLRFCSPLFWALSHLFPLSSFCYCVGICFYFWGVILMSSTHDPSCRLLMSSFIISCFVFLSNLSQPYLWDAALFP